MARLFGTDGVRGVANVELTPELVYKLGRAGAYVLTKHTNHTAKIIVGMDTRISGDMLESALIAGICSVGAHAVSLGIVPTPAVAYLVRKLGADFMKFATERGMVGIKGHRSVGGLRA